MERLIIFFQEHGFLPFSCVVLLNYGDDYKTTKIETLKLLLRSGADINAKDRAYNYISILIIMINIMLLILIIAWDDCAALLYVYFTRYGHDSISYWCRGRLAREVHRGIILKHDYSLYVVWLYIHS